MEIDLKRSVKAVRDMVEGGFSGRDTAHAGEMMPYSVLTDGQSVHAGYTVFCPGCGERLSMPTIGPGPHWQESGDLDAGTLTVSPSVWHQHGCGWHGWLRDGWFRPV